MQTHRRAQIIFLSLLVLLRLPAKADEVKYLAHADEALVAFTQLAEGAKTSIDLATFIFEPCETSTQILMQILERKSRSGVRVRLMLDDVMQNGKNKKALADYAAKHGIGLRFYNTIEKNFRTHIKLMVVDGRAYISGGRNISDRYFGLSPVKNFIDRDLLVKGPSATEAAKSFDELWRAELTSKKKGDAKSFASWNAVCGFDDSARIKTVKDFLSRHADLVERIPARSCENVRFIADNPEFNNGRYGNPSREAYWTPERLREKRTSFYLLDYLASARESLRMENWVYMPIRALSDAIKKSRDRNVRIRVITNRDTEDGPRIFRDAMDYAVAQYAQKHSVKDQEVKLLSTHGSMTDAHELTPLGSHFYLHGKIFLRDGRDAVVGSYNLDQRSFGTNLESLVAVRNCPRLNDDIKEEASKLFTTYHQDQGQVPPKEEPSLAAKLLARAFLRFL